MITRARFLFWTDVVLITLLMPLIIMLVLVVCLSLAIARWLGLVGNDENQ